MLRAVLSIAIALLLTSCVHKRSNDSEDPAVIAVAQFVVEAIAPAERDDYKWVAFDARVANLAQWGATQTWGETGAELRREGRITGRGGGQSIVAVGDADHITTLSINTNTFHGVALLEALRRAGADVSFQGDFESYSEHVITPSGRDVAVLTTNSTCIPFDRRPGEICRNYVTLTFNPW